MNARTLPALIASAALIVAACGDDDDGGGSNADFCSLIQEESAVFADDSDGEDAVAGLQELVAAAPSEIKDDVQEILDAAVVLNEVDFNELSEEEFEELNAQFENLDQAQANAEEWVLANCDDVPDDFFE